MKFPIYRSSLMMRWWVIFCLAATLVCAQSPPSPLFLELKACAGELQVFDDGMVISKYIDGTMTERRLSQSRMLKLRQIIARGPCQKEIRTSTATAETSYCVGVWRSYNAPGEQEVVIRHYPDHQSEPFPIYIPCDTTKEHDPRNNPIWQRLLSEVVGAIGGKSILKGCKCRKEFFNNTNAAYNNSLDRSGGNVFHNMTGFCPQYPTRRCFAGDGGVLSAWDNVTSFFGIAA